MQGNNISHIKQIPEELARLIAEFLNRKPEPSRITHATFMNSRKDIATARTNLSDLLLDHTDGTECTGALIYPHTLYQGTLELEFFVRVGTVVTQLASNSIASIHIPQYAHYTRLNPPDPPTQTTLRPPNSLYTLNSKLQQNLKYALGSIKIPDVHHLSCASHFWHSTVNTTKTAKEVFLTARIKHHLPLYLRPFTSAYLQERRYKSQAITTAPTKPTKMEQILSRTDIPRQAQFVCAFIFFSAQLWYMNALTNENIAILSFFALFAGAIIKGYGINDEEINHTHNPVPFHLAHFKACEDLEKHEAAHALTSNDMASTKTEEIAGTEENQDESETGLRRRAVA